MIKIYKSHKKNFQVGYQQQLLLYFVLNKNIMETTETICNLESVNSTFEKIKYYLHLPAHIKGTAAVLDNVPLRGTVDYGPNSPAHVVDGSITAIHGRVNIPDINVISKLYEVINEPLLLLIN